MSDLALKKKKLLGASKSAFLFSAMLAGAYVGIAVVLVYIIGDPIVQSFPALTPLVMGLAFGVALLLVIYAGSDLFTGSVLYYTISTLNKKTTIKDTLVNWSWTYGGNLLGALFIAILIYLAGIFNGITENHYLFYMAEEKMTGGAMELFFKGIFCNWLVCLAIWTPMRLKNEMAKLFVVFIIIFAFFASGYEHSVANMGLFHLALLHNPGIETISMAGYFANMIPVTVGNIIGGSVFVGMAYYYISKKSELDSLTND
ncbi:formate/nitrite transporter family protein [Shouchella xiaoxiensis]|uniref:formate/nitrite transporter family protein n=1 Tax=Shouchella xiaoxiensis TaxID=766895 RepID=UPI0023BB10B2|nr:formate/nitrite transporter family protein [Shouchella xiaoxiensis]